MAIYDTPGFELERSQQGKVVNEILDLIRKGYSSGDINERIHCIWYCVNVGGNRFGEDEIKWIKKFTDENKVTQVPMMVVLTQGVPKKKAQEMAKNIEAENLDIVKVVPLLAQDMDIDGDEKNYVRAYGLDTLITAMAEFLPSELQYTLQNVQKASMELKRTKSHAIVAAAVASSFGEGFAPIPFSDSALLIPTQATMIAGISAIYGLDINKTFLTFFVSSTLGSTGATVLGKTVVANLLKLIPAAGTAAGGVISGTTAGLITTALGEAYIKIMEMIYTGEMSKEELETEAGQKKMRRLFEKELHHRKRKAFFHKPFRKK